VATLGKEVQV